MGNGRVRLKAHHFLLFLLYSEVAGRGGSHLFTMCALLPQGTFGILSQQ